MTSRLRSLLLLPVLLAVVMAAACAAPSEGGSTASAVRIGVADGSEAYWQVFTQKAKAAGIDVELVNFTDYNQPNPALAQKQLQLNQFQHLQYLANYNVKNNDTLVPIGATAVYPLPLYSLKHARVADIPAGGQVAVPNDPTNQARALLVLQAAKLITLKGGGNTLSTPGDIDPAASKVTVVPVDAAQTAANLPSVDGAIVNNNYAVAAKLGQDKVIFPDDPNADTAKPYINLFVSRAEDKDNPTFQRLVAIYHEPEVEAAFKAEYGSSAVLKNNPAADLQATTTALENLIRKGGA